MDRSGEEVSHSVTSDETSRLEPSKAHFQSTEVPLASGGDGVHDVSLKQLTMLTQT